MPHKNIPMGRKGPFGVCVRTAVADLDGDGKFEIVIADADIEDSRVAILKNADGKGGRVDYPVSWTSNGWDFEAAGMEDCIAEDWAHGIPVLNTEFGYQDEPGGESTYGVQTRRFTTRSTVRKKAWKIATAGAYFSAGYINVAVSYEFTAKEVDHFRPEQLETLYKFFTTKTEYWKMAKSNIIP